jgi:hypothetical protein
MYLVLALLAAPVIAGPAAAQQRVVVPAGVDVVIPPRGVDGPALVRAPRPRIPAPGQPVARPMLETGAGAGGAGVGLAAPGLIALPLIAAAAFLAGTVPGNSSSSSTSAPARTR